MPLSSSQKGRIIESQIANMLMIVSDGELTPSVPIVDDHGVDLVVTARGGFSALFLQVKSRFVTNKRYQNKVQFNYGRNALIEARELYGLSVYYDKEKGAIDTMWLVPSRLLIECANINDKFHVMAANRSPESQDKWSQFKVTPQRLCEVLLDKLKGTWS